MKYVLVLAISGANAPAIAVACGASRWSQPEAATPEAPAAKQSAGAKLAYPFDADTVVAGQRKYLEGAKLKVTSGVWHTLRVTSVGNRITCLFYDEQTFTTTDDALKDAGKVGLWTKTKADSATYFDDLRVAAR